MRIQSKHFDIKVPLLVTGHFQAGDLWEAVADLMHPVGHLSVPVCLVIHVSHNNANNNREGCNAHGRRDVYPYNKQSHNK